MSTPDNKRFVDLLEEINVIDKLLLEDVIGDFEKLLIYRWCDFNYKQWQKFCKKYQLNKWSVVPAKEVMKELLNKVLTWEMERVKKNSLSMCIVILKIHELVDEDVVLSKIQKMVHLTDYVFFLGDRRYLIVYTDTSLFSSKKKVLEILSGLKREFSSFETRVSAGIVCYKGKKGITPEYIVDLADKVREEAFKDHKPIGVGPILAEELEKKFQVTAEEKRFLFSL